LLGAIQGDHEVADINYDDHQYTWKQNILNNGKIQISEIYHHFVHVSLALNASIQHNNIQHLKVVQNWSTQCAHVRCLDV
jgi:hypothetical protein